MNQEQIKSFYDDFSGRLIKDFLGANKRVESALIGILTKIPLSATKILDIGCGIGWSSYEIARHFPGAEVTGVDLSPNLIAQAQQIFSRPNLAFKILDVISPSFNVKRLGATYDAIVMIDVFEHLQKEARQAFYAETASLLNNGGLIYLAFPSRFHLEYYMMKAPEKLQPIDNIVLLEDIQEWAKYIEGTVLWYEHKSIWKDNDYVHAMLQAGEIHYKDKDKQFLGKASLCTLLQRVRLIAHAYPTDKWEIYAFYLRRQLGNWWRAILSRTVWGSEAQS